MSARHPGEMIHIDIKKLGRFERIGHRITGDRTGPNKSRGAGWDFVHVCIDDHSRVAFSEIKPDETADSAVPFLKAAVAYYKSLGVTVTRVMTDNGSCYQAFAFRDACRDLGIKHIRTKPYTPKTNGKAERFIQTALREWAYAQAYPTSDRRAARAADLAAPIQLAPTPRWYKISNADQQARSNQGQPLEAPHLVHDRAPHMPRPWSTHFPPHRHRLGRQFWSNSALILAGGLCCPRTLRGAGSSSASPGNTVGSALSSAAQSAARHW